MKQVLVTIFVAISAMAQQPAQVEQTERKEFPTLRSSWGSGDIVKLHISSAVDRWDSLISPESLEKLSDEERDQVTLFIYTYTFQNDGKTKIKFVLSDFEVLKSPLTDILQDFAITLEPSQTRTIKFHATSTPKFASTAKVIKVWNNESKRWHNHGGGATSIYIPQWNALWQEMTEH